ncbi:hypothetical protein ACQW02_03550 [Humitalea sp. 24SJ18S-53]|uniref:hypothetical protein n=1 Tax=Humitalea sp. 24SJ18S-53 TaxID=3422307 RepID=UPI003D6699CB
MVVSQYAAAQTVTVPSRGFYIGAGGSYNSVGFGAQDAFAMGTSDIYQRGALVSTGEAGGPARIYMPRESGFAPSAQAGYFQHFPGSNWLWGGKFSYSHVAVDSTVQDARIHQVGSFAQVGSGSQIPFTGNVVVRSFETRLNHQLTLTPFLGRSYDRGFFYVGAGPTLTESETSMNGMIGFADINGDRTNVSGPPANFSGTSWVAGAAFVVGATYFFDSAWFMDFTYTYSVTGTAKMDFSGPFTNPNADQGVTTIGVLSGNSSGSLSTQGLTITINRAF